MTALEQFLKQTNVKTDNNTKPTRTPEAVRKRLDKLVWSCNVQNSNRPALDFFATLMEDTWEHLSKKSITAAENEANRNLIIEIWTNDYQSKFSKWWLETPEGRAYKRQTDDYIDKMQGGDFV